MKPDNFDEMSSFGALHEKINNWVCVKELKFTGKICHDRSDDLDEVIFRMWDVPYSKKAARSGLTYLFHTFDGKIKPTDVEWLWSDHALALFKAKVQLKSITEITW